MICLVVSISDIWIMRMDARKVILSVLTKRDLIYLKRRFYEIKKNAVDSKTSLIEQDSFTVFILSMARFCSTGIDMFCLIFFAFFIYAFFQDDTLKMLIVTSITCIIMFVFFLYALHKQTGFSYLLCSKFLLIRSRCLLLRKG